MKTLPESVDSILRGNRADSADRAVCAQRINSCVEVPGSSEIAGSSLYQYLEMDHLIDKFSGQLHSSVPFDLLTFKCAELGQRLEKLFCKPAVEYRYQLGFSIDDRQARLGVMEIGRNRQFLSSEIRLIKARVAKLAGPLRNASLYMKACQSAYRDPLTGVKNRAALDATLSLDTATGSSALIPQVLMVCDVDRFKAINDNCGHVVGDEVLRQFATTLQANTREGDLVYRYGGDEFVIALSNSIKDGGREYAERIRQSIQRNTLYVANACINLTTTIGLTEVRQDESLDEAFLRADDALLAGKKSGKNRVVCH